MAEGVADHVEGESLLRGGGISAAGPEAPSCGDGQWDGFGAL